MANKTFNNFSSYQSNFGENTDYAGWEITSGNGSLSRVLDKSLWWTYVPNYESTETNSGFKNVLVVRSHGEADIVVKSPWVPVAALDRHMVSLLAKVEGINASVFLDFEVNSEPSGEGDTSETNSELTVGSQQDYNNGEARALFGGFASLGNTSAARMVITFSGIYDETLTDTAVLSFDDPVICEDGIAKTMLFTNLMYNSLPAFMLLDDNQINLISDNPLMFSFPLQRMVESLSSPAARIADITASFDYVRATDGVESKSALTDPVTAAPSYLPWLACVIGGELWVPASGFTPWAAFSDENGAFDWADFDAIDGDEGLGEQVEWLKLQGYDVDFFDTIQSWRDQIETGFIGVHAGRSDSIEAFLRTQLSSDTSSTDVVSVISADRDSPFRVEILIDPDSDPDPTGTLLEHAVEHSMVAGGNAVRVSKVLNSAQGGYNFATAFGDTESNINTGGVTYYGKSFISDIEGYGRNILLNTSAASAVAPELGGGIGAAHFRSGSQYFYGAVSSSEYGSLLTDASGSADLGGNDEGYDVIAIISDATLPASTVATGGSGGNIPADWFLRDKRLLVSGQSDNGGNDWALYVVSGVTPDNDKEARLLLIDGYDTVGADNFAYSEPIDFSGLGHGGEFAVRVCRGKVDEGSAMVTFFAQNTIYSDWNTNVVGTSYITPSSVAAGDSASVQVLGSIGEGESWADAGPLSCAVSRVMIYSDPLKFDRVEYFSENPHACLEGRLTDSLSNYTYTPTVDIDVSTVPFYSSTFNAMCSDSSSLIVSVKESATNDLDMLVAQPIGGTESFWYFGTAAANGDTLSVDGLTPNASHDVFVTVYDLDAFGEEKTFNHPASSDENGVLSIASDDVYDDTTTYGGSAIKKISVFYTDDDETETEEACFTSSTIEGGATEGNDSIDPLKTWTLDRAFPSSAVAYAPSQAVNEAFVQVYEGSLWMTNPMKIESHTPFSVALRIKRLWSEGGTADIFKLHTADSDGLTIYFDDSELCASFTEAENVERVSWEDPSVGAWRVVVVRRDPQGNFSLMVDGDEVDFSPAISTAPFASEIVASVLSEGDANTFNALFSLSEFATYDRYLSDEEVSLLNDQIS